MFAIGWHKRKCSEEERRARNGKRKPHEEDRAATSSRRAPVPGAATVRPRCTPNQSDELVRGQPTSALRGATSRGLARPVGRVEAGSAGVREINQPTTFVLSPK